MGIHSGGEIAHGIGFSREMEGPPGELSKCLKEDGDECLDVPRSVFGSLYDFPVIRIRETDPDPTVIFSAGSCDIIRMEAVRTYGWSRKKMLASLFQLYGFQVDPLEDRLSISMLHGPSSMRRPIELEHPGPGSGSITLILIPE